jgi:hypothetical protein
MHAGRFVFAQLIDHLPAYEFSKCVARYRSNYKLRGFSCLDQFLCLAFAQLTLREGSATSRHACDLSRASSITWASAARSREQRWPTPTRLMTGASTPTSPKSSSTSRAQCTPAKPLGFDLDNTVYTLDSTTIDLCLSVFPWARLRARKAPSRCIPCSIYAAQSQRLSRFPTANCTT